MSDFWIILTGSIVAVSCSLLGCYLVLRNMAMVGDAISHAVLPGIVIAFLISSSRDSFTMLIGAGLIGMLTTFLIEFFHKKGKLQPDASIGVTFTWLFAIGIILVTAFASKVDLDQECVLYGEIAYVPLDMLITGSGKLLGPRAVWVSGGVLIVNLILIILFYRPLLISTFDPSFASAIGIATGVWHYVLMGAVSLTTVASFESVGAILVVAFIVGPAASGYLLTNRFKTMLILSVVISILSAVGGYYLSYFINSSIAGAIATVIGLFFVVILLFSPKKGIIPRRRALKLDIPNQ